MKKLKTLVPASTIDFINPQSFSYNTSTQLLLCERDTALRQLDELVRQQQRMEELADVRKKTTTDMQSQANAVEVGLVSKLESANCEIKRHQQRDVDAELASAKKQLTILLYRGKSAM